MLKAVETKFMLLFHIGNESHESHKYLFPTMQTFEQCHVTEKIQRSQTVCWLVKQIQSPM